MERVNRTAERTETHFRETTGFLFGKRWLISPIILFGATSVVFLVVFPMVILGVERDGKYDRFLLISGLVHFLGLVAGQKALVPEGRTRRRRIETGRGFFRACWLAWVLLASYKLAMLLLGGIARYQHEESEAFLHIPYFQMVLDSLAFRVAPFLAWVAARGRLSPGLIAAVAVDLFFGVATLTKEYAMYTVLCGAFGLCYWRRRPPLAFAMTGLIAIISVFLIGPALVWTRAETIAFPHPLEVLEGVAKNVDRTLVDEIQRDVTLLAAKERFDLYSSGLLAMQEEEFGRVSEEIRDALPLFWLFRSQEKEVTFRSANYLGVAVGLAEEGDKSGIAFPNPVVLRGMFGGEAAIVLFGGFGYLFGAAFRRVGETRALEWWIGYLLLYLDIIVQLYIGLPVPAIPFKLVYDLFAWGTAIALIRTCRRVTALSVGS